MKQMKRVLIVLCAVLCALSLVLPTFAAATVTYDEKTEKLVFDATGAKTPTDLFENFKDVMPGDVLTQEISLVNKDSNRVKLDVYLRLVATDTDSKNLLSQMTMKIAYEERVLFDAAADTTGALTDWVKLGSLYAGGSAKLKLTLTVPLTVGDDFQKAAASVKWQFKTDEYPIDTQTVVCPECHNPMEIITTPDGSSEGAVAKYRCTHCVHEEVMKCETCGKDMKQVIVKGADGKYYIYYECSDPEHHTVPETYDAPFNALWLPLVVISGAGIGFCIFWLKRKKNTEEEPA